MIINFNVFYDFCRNIVESCLNASSQVFVWLNMSTDQFASNFSTPLFQWLFSLPGLIPGVKYMKMYEFIIWALFVLVLVKGTVKALLSWA